MTILEEARALRAYLTGLRRDLHRHPELSWQETRTQALICRELDGLGIPYEKACGTGVLAELHGAGDGPAVGLRADMDALPIAEQNDCAYRSETPGVMHACGHDCHVAMLLGAARILKAREAELRGTVKLIFQPAEEVIEGARDVYAAPARRSRPRVRRARVDRPSGRAAVGRGRPPVSTRA